MILGVEQAIDRLEDLAASLLEIIAEVERTRDVHHGDERLSRWADRVAAILGNEISGRVAAQFMQTASPFLKDPSARFVARFKSYDSFLRALLSDMRDDPEYWEDVLTSQSEEDDEGDDGDEEGGERPCVFIGHGRSPHWSRVQRFIERDLKLDTLAFESESRAGHHVVDVLQRMLRESDFAVIVLTAEDSTQDGTRRARQNVVHEVGLAQGRFGFERAILIVQEGVEEFSNIAGLQQLRFRADGIEAVFDGLRGALKREGLV